MMPKTPPSTSLLAKVRRVLMPRVKVLVAYVRHKIARTPYASFYGRLMDIRLQYYPAWGLAATKEFQLEFLKAQGLRPSMRFLDYGCGAAAAGRYFIRYLEAKRYTGADISEGVLAEARRRIAEWGLATKEPEFVLLPSGRLDALYGRRFDMIWAQSVLTHMPPDDIKTLFRQLPALLMDGGVFFANFACADGVRQSQLKDWYYPAATILQMAQDCGLCAQLVPDWRHPQDDQGRDTLVRLTLAQALQQ